MPVVKRISLFCEPLYERETSNVIWSIGGSCSKSAETSAPTLASITGHFKSTRSTLPSNIASLLFAYHCAESRAVLTSGGGQTHLQPNVGTDKNVKANATKAWTRTVSPLAHLSSAWDVPMGKGIQIPFPSCQLRPSLRSSVSSRSSLRALCVNSPLNLDSPLLTSTHPRPKLPASGLPPAGKASRATACAFPSCSHWHLWYLPHSRRSARHHLPRLLRLPPLQARLGLRLSLIHRCSQPIRDKTL
jgi:hypothetical protein